MNANPIQCPRCGFVNRPQARFCGDCGQKLGDMQAATTVTAPPSPPQPAMAEMRWQRRPGEIAARITAKDLPASARGVLVIDEGLHAIILRDGQVYGKQGPGIYQLDRGRGFFGLGTGENVTAVVVDGGEIALRFALRDLWTMDPLRLSAECRLAVAVTDPDLFAQRVVKDLALFAEPDLRALLYDEVRDAAQAYVADHSMEQLEESLARRSEEFGVDVQMRLGATFEAMGLSFSRVQILDLRHPRFDQIKQREEELFLGPAELHHKQRLFDLYTQEQLLEDAKEEGKVAQYERRSQLWARMRRAVQQERVNETTTQDELERFMVEMERQKLLREDELGQMRDALTWQGEDRRRARAHAVAMAQLAEESEGQAATLAAKFSQDETRLQHELTLSRAEIMGRLAVEQARVETTLELAALQAARRREQEELDAAALRKRIVDAARAARAEELEKAQGEAERARIRIEIERLEDQADLATAADAQALQRHDQAEKWRMEREHWIATEQARLDAQERALRIELQRKSEEQRLELERQAAAQRAALEAEAQRQQHELARMERMATFSVEALIAISGDAQGELLAELKRSELSAGMTEEQILASNAVKSPALAEVLKAKYQAAADGRLSAAEAEKWQAIAETMQQHEAEQRRQTDAILDRMERAAREAAERQERSNTEALRQVGDVAKAFAQKPESGSTIVFGAGGVVGGGAVGPGGGPGGGMVGPGAGGRVQVCPKCRVESEVGSKHCQNCGYSFFG